MSKNVDFFEFQLATLEAAAANNDGVRLFWGYGTDNEAHYANRLELYTDSDGEKYWRMNLVSTSGGTEIHVGRREYLAAAARIASRNSYGRPLVAANSQQLFKDALEAADIVGRNSQNVTPEGHYTYYGFQAQLDFSPIKYCGAFQFIDAELSEFLPANKPALLDANTRTDYSGFNQKQKIGKSLRYVLDCLGLDYTDSAIESAVNFIKAQNSPLEIVLASETGADISEIYDTEAARSTGSLENSCMRGHGDYYYDLDRGENVDIAYCLNANGELVGRALVWQTVEGPKVMDRIYGSDATIVAFKKFASSKGWYHKEHQSYDAKRDWVKPDGFTTSQSFEIEIDLVSCIGDECAPYMDTFCYYGEEPERLTNSTSFANDFDGPVYELRNTDGTADRRN